MGLEQTNSLDCDLHRWVDWLLFPELVRGGVVVTNSAGVFNEAMAEYALALVSAVCADLHTTLRLQHARAWQHRKRPASLAAGSLWLAPVASAAPSPGS